MEDLAIVGTGIAGMGAAHYLKNRFTITFFEKNNYPGGHTHTIEHRAKDETVAFDTGFMVFNKVTYPLLTSLFLELEVPIRKTSMSFSVQHLPSGLEYCGSGLNGLFAQRKNIFNPSYISMLLQISRFNKIAIQHIKEGLETHDSISTFVEKHGLGRPMLERYLIPMSAAVWSTPPGKMESFPAQTLIRFFYNHGFLGLNTQHQWYTVTGGSRVYRDKILKPFEGNIFLNRGVKKILRREEGVELVFDDNTTRKFPRVLLACHADEALHLLGNPEKNETRLLSEFRYNDNLATVHTDESIMPKNRKAWSSWNYRIEKTATGETASTIYWMNSLQGVSEKANYFVSINDPGKIHPSKIISTLPYTHPIFNLETQEAQKELESLNTRGTIFFAGSYFRYGFHEDALLSGKWAAEKLMAAL